MTQKVYTFDEGYQSKSSQFKPIQYTINPVTGCWEVYGRMPKKTDGYHRVERNGKRMHLHRYVYEITYGKIPEGVVVRHKCDNPVCMNPEHLELGTQTDNMRDMVERGRHYSKLTADQVIQIFLSTEPHKVLAEQYNVDPTLISLIQKGKVWRHVTKDLTPPIRPAKQYKLNVNTIKEIFLAEGTIAEIAQRFGVAKSLVSQIKNGKVHAHITAPLRNRADQQRR